MSGTLAEKIQILQSLDERHKTVLDALMADRNFKIPELADSLGYGTSTVRNFLTDIYEVCGVPEGEEDKRGYIIREYSEAYLKMGLPPEPKTEIPKPSKLSDEPRINVAPGAPRTNRRAITVGLVIGFVVVAIVAIGILVAIISVLNYPNKGFLGSGRYNAYDDIRLAQGVVLSGGGYGGGVCDTYEDTWTQSLGVTNSSGYDYSLGIGSTRFSLVDNFGNSYQLFSSEIVGISSGIKSKTIYSGHSATIMLCWLGRPDHSGAQYLDLKIMNLTNGGNDITIRYNP